MKAVDGVLKMLPTIQMAGMQIVRRCENASNPVIATQLALSVPY